MKQLQSERLSFRQYTLDDFENYYLLCSNSEVLKMITGSTFTREETWERFHKILKINAAHPDSGVYSVRLLETEEYIGLGKLEFKSGTEAELGYTFLPPFWGNGYGKELGKRLVEHGRTLDYIDEIVGYIHPENIPSQKILEASGLQFVENTIMDDLPTGIYRMKL